MVARVLLRDRPQRAIALVTSTHALIFRHTSSGGSVNASTTSLQSTASSGGGPRCIVELVSLGKADLSEYRTISHNAHGTLGLITLENDVFLCVVSSSSRVASPRPDETVQKISSVDFYCLNKTDYDYILHEDAGLYPSDGLDEDVYGHPHAAGRRDPTLEHPCLALKKMLSGGSFYYSTDVDLTNRVQDRSGGGSTFDLDSFDKGYLWNSYMIKPLIDFRSRLSSIEKDELDSTNLLTSAIQGFALTINIPAPSSPVRTSRTGLPSTLTLISRLSCKRAGTRFNARGIDDDGNVANFVETETIFWSPSGLCFSYVQIRGSIPLFWEQAPGLLPGQQKIQITRSPQASQPAFDKHFEDLEVKYSSIHVVNLLSNEKPGEVELSSRYREHVGRSSLNSREDSDHAFLRETDYDFHAETRGASGFEAASSIRYLIEDSAEGFGYCLTENTDNNEKGLDIGDLLEQRSVNILQQQGVFRTNCLDCLDRTNLVQTIISLMAFETFLNHRGEKVNSDLIARHGSLWADNGDGRLMGQAPVYLFDPINDYVTGELARRAPEFTSEKEWRIWTGTLNLNGRMNGLKEDLLPWLFPENDMSQDAPHIVAVGFQEIVELSPQQIMSTEPGRRSAWEKVVIESLNTKAQKEGLEEYVLLRGGQLVGASLSIFVKSSALSHIKDVEASMKKTGMSGMAGNKGAVAIRMDIENTSMCFVTAHLAAGFANHEERNRDYYTISHGLRFQRNRSIDDHTTVIWLGDFNYRIGLGAEKVKSLIAGGEIDQLYDNDQLNLQMLHGRAFPHYSEARILFPPTYKFDVGTDDYDTSEKGRIPAWCDRVLWKGHNLRQTAYSIAPLRFSDHRPVYALFKCTVNVVDSAYRDQLSSKIYAQRRAAVGDTTANDESEDDDLIGYESIEPGLPPASSDRSKWWLDKGLPVRSQVEPPSGDHVPNPARPSNPFAPTAEPDWVRQSGTESPPPAPPSRALSTRQTGSPMSSAAGQSGVARSNTAKASMQTQPAQAMVARKPAPPLVPRKPNSLATASSQPPASTTTTGSGLGWGNRAQEPPPPPKPRRAPGPPGAPTTLTTTGSLLDLDDDNQNQTGSGGDPYADEGAGAQKAGGLSGWAPLKPS
ncbi:MAG: inositol polyphosphate 5-phosphatase [Alyxoria varia]|nr:MAG: inositol polyphosphate 5-phosphatase [Alyxoria varia]